MKIAVARAWSKARTTPGEQHVRIRGGGGRRCAHSLSIAVLRGPRDGGPRIRGLPESVIPPRRLFTSCRRPGRRIRDGRARSGHCPGRSRLGLRHGRELARSPFAPSAGEPMGLSEEASGQNGQNAPERGSRTRTRRTDARQRRALPCRLLDKLEDELPLVRDVIAKERALAAMKAGPAEQGRRVARGAPCPRRLLAAEAWDRAVRRDAHAHRCDRVLAAEKRTRSQEEGPGTASSHRPRGQRRKHARGGRTDGSPSTRSIRSRRDGTGGRRSPRASQAAHRRRVRDACARSLGPAARTTRSRCWSAPTTRRASSRR